MTGIAPATATESPSVSRVVGKPKRQEYLDVAKGVAILLVVVGHAVTRSTPEGAEWFVWLRGRIYLFHMPLFMFISGMVYGLTWRAPDSLSAYFVDIKKRLSRLLPAYLLFGLLIYAGKLIFQAFSEVDNPVTGVESLLEMVTIPTLSFASFLWYIYVLSILFVVFPVLFTLFRGSIWLVWLGSCFLWLFPASPYVAWDKFQTLAPFFLAGVMAGRHHERFTALLKNWWVLALPVFLVGAAYSPLRSAGAMVTAVAAIPVLLGPLYLLDVRRRERTPPPVWNWLMEIGRYTLVIYLLNTIAIGLARVAVVHSVGWSGARYPLAFLALMLAGTYIPLLLKRHAFVRIRWLDRITS